MANNKKNKPANNTKDNTKEVTEPVAEIKIIDEPVTEETKEDTTKVEIPDSKVIKKPSVTPAKSQKQTNKSKDLYVKIKPTTLFFCDGRKISSGLYYTKILAIRNGNSITLKDRDGATLGTLNIDSVIL